MRANADTLPAKPMLDLKDVYYFVHVVDRGGFTAAGDSLRLPKSTLMTFIKMGSKVTRFLGRGKD